MLGPILKNAAKIFFCIALTANMAMADMAQKLPAWKQALDHIAKFADDYCKVVGLEGSSTDTTVSGKAGVEASNFAKKLVDMGLEAAGKYVENKYSGAERKDLPNVFKSNLDCRTYIWNDLKNILNDSGGASSKQGKSTPLLDYNGPPLWASPAEVSADYKSGEWKYFPDGSKWFVYQTDFGENMPFKATITLYQPSKAIDFNAADFNLYALYSDYDTNVPVSSPLYPKDTDRNGSIETVRELCGNTFNIMLSNISDKLGGVLDKPSVNDSSSLIPPGCDTNNSCFQALHEVNTIVHFVGFRKLVLKKSEGSMNTFIEHGAGLKTRLTNGNCSIDVLVNDPKSLKQVAGQ